MPTPRTIDNLLPRELENLAYDVIVGLGFTKAVWRTPGADGGRDIEAAFAARDASGTIDDQKWYIECKRYETSVDWPTVWNKISYADNHGADFLLIFSNSNPSPTCETEIAAWNAARRSTKVRFWRGYDVEDLVRKMPSIAFKYGLRSPQTSIASGLFELSIELTKIVQATYAAHDLGQQISVGLEAAAAISELLTAVTDDLHRYGRRVFGGDDGLDVGYEWVLTERYRPNASNVSLRALLATMRYVYGGGTASIEGQAHGFAVLLQGLDREIRPGLPNLIKMVALWCDFEVYPPECREHELVLQVGERR